MIGNTHLNIGERKVGPGEPVYVIAEMSANHNHDFDQALAIMRAAKESGADAIKIQTYTPDTMTIDSRVECFIIGKGTPWEGRNLYALYGEAYTPWEWQPKLQRAAEDLGLDFFSTAFDETAVDFLEGMAVPIHKIASFELVDLPLIRRMARTGKPMIMSTGMSTLEEITEAVETARQAGATQLALLKCTSAYPAPPEEMNLSTIPHLTRAFSVPAGLSDHTLGTTVPVAAVALGACIVEKHFTLSRRAPGPDSSFSLEPAEFKAMVDAIRIAERSLGKVAFGSGKREESSKVFRRSLFAVKDIRAGETLDAANIRCIRPGYGLHSRHYDEVMGRRAAKDIPRGTPLAWSLISS